MQRRDVPVPDVLLVDRVQRRLLERESDFDQAGVVGVRHRGLSREGQQFGGGYDPCFCIRCSSIQRRPVSSSGTGESPLSQPDQFPDRSDRILAGLVEPLAPRGRPGQLAHLAKGEGAPDARFPGDLSLRCGGAASSIVSVVQEFAARSRSREALWRVTGWTRP